MVHKTNMPDQLFPRKETILFCVAVSLWLSVMHYLNEYESIETATFKALH